jgi:hypothetical protein
MRTFALFLLVAACDAREARREPPPPPPQPAPAEARVLRAPPKLVWDTKYGVKLSFDDKAFDPGMRCEFSIIEDKAKKPAFNVHCFDPNNRKAVRPEVDMPGYKRFGYDFEAKFSGDLLPAIGDTPISALLVDNAKVVIPATVRLTARNYGTFEVKPPMWWISGSDIVRGLLGVRFANEPTDDGKLTAVLLHDGYVGHEILGATTGKLHDIDWIAVRTDDEKGQKLGCRPNTTLYVESNATIYDRRTGSPVDTKHFVGKPVCPRVDYYTTVGGNVVASKASAVRHKDVAAYIKEQLRKRGRSEARAR